MRKVCLLTAAVVFGTPCARAFDEMGSMPMESVPEEMRPGRSDPIDTDAIVAAAMDMRARRSKGIGQLMGTFVAECQPNISSWWGTGSFGSGISSAKTTKYVDSDDGLGDSTYEVDYTEYVGDTCDPKVDTILAKYNLQGIVKFHGNNPNPGKSAAMEGAIQAEWITTGSTWIFPQSDSPYLKTWVDTLNDQCKCGQGGWEIGVTKTIKPKQCHLKDGNDYNYLCYLANGTTGWANYKWLDTSPDEPKTYIAGPISFDRVEGWSKPPTSIPRYKLPQGGVRDPNDCNQLTWYSCGNGIQEAAEYCNGCTSLECTGCLKNSTFWARCCPCDYYWGSKSKKWNWMAQLDC